MQNSRHSWTRLALAGLLALTLPLGPLASCGGSSDPGQLTDSGYASLGKGNAKAALSSFEKALRAGNLDGDLALSHFGALLRSQAFRRCRSDWSSPRMRGGCTPIALR